MYLGTIKTWKDPKIARLKPGVSLPSTAVHPVDRSDASDDTFALTDYLSSVSQQWKSRVSGASTAGSRPIAAAAATASFRSDNSVSIVDQPASAKSAYPLSTFTYAIVPQSSSKTAALKTFMTYAVTAGQQHATELQFAPLPQNVVAKDESIVNGLSPARDRGARRGGATGSPAPASARRARAASSSSRHVTPGRFIRASLPSPSTSCAGTIASLAGDAYAISIRPQCGSRGSSPVAARRRGGRSRYQPTACRCRACSCRRRELERWFSGRCGLRAAAAEGPVEHDHARQAELVPQPVDGRRDATEVLRDQRQPPELALDGAEELRARTGPPAAVLGRPVPLRDRPVGDEAAEVVDAAEVDELERAAEALAPPAVARRAGAPASRRAGSPRAGRSR